MNDGHASALRGLAAKRDYGRGKAHAWQVKKLSWGKRIVEAIRDPIECSILPQINKAVLLGAERWCRDRGKDFYFGYVLAYLDSDEYKRATHKPDTRKKEPSLADILELWRKAHPDDKDKFKPGAMDKAREWHRKKGQAK